MAGSIRAAIEADKILGGVVSDCYVKSFRLLGQQEIDAYGAFGGEFIVPVLAQHTSTVGQIITALKTALGTISGLTVSGVKVGSTPTPYAIVMPPDFDYLETFGGSTGHYQIDFSVLVLVGSQIADDAVTALVAYTNWS
jgi:hypothetical protein